MTRQEFIDEIMRLSVADRIALIEAISRSLREDLEANGASTATPDAPASDAPDELAHRRDAVRRLRGALKFDGPAPSDEEVKEIITDYLIEKYS
jgi:hypothetical protein